MDTILRLRHLKQTTGLGKTSIYALINAGNFPRPVKLGGRAVGWRSSDVQAWLESLKVA